MGDTLQVGADLWKLGGIAAVLLAILVYGGWLMFRFFTKMVTNLGTRLDAVQDRQVNELSILVKENTASNREVTEASRQSVALTRQMIDVMRTRPCYQETDRYPAKKPGLSQNPGLTP